MCRRLDGGRLRHRGGIPRRIIDEVRIILMRNLNTGGGTIKPLYAIH
jgi:hypothetical protein